MAPWFNASVSERRAAFHEEINRLPAAYRTALVLCETDTIYSRRGALLRPPARRFTLP